MNKMQILSLGSDSFEVEDVDAVKYFTPNGALVDARNADGEVVSKIPLQEDKLLCDIKVVNNVATDTINGVEIKSSGDVSLVTSNDVVTLPKTVANTKQIQPIAAPYKISLDVDHIDVPTNLFNAENKFKIFGYTDEPNAGLYFKIKCDTGSWPYTRLNQTELCFKATDNSQEIVITSNSSLEPEDLAGKTLSLYLCTKVTYKNSRAELEYDSNCLAVQVDDNFIESQPYQYYFTSNDLLPCGYGWDDTLTIGSSDMIAQSSQEIDFARYTITLLASAMSKFIKKSTGYFVTQLSNVDLDITDYMYSDIKITILDTATGDLYMTIVRHTGTDIYDSYGGTNTAITKTSSANVTITDGEAKVILPVQIYHDGYMIIENI